MLHYIALSFEYHIMMFNTACAVAFVEDVIGWITTLLYSNLYEGDVDEETGDKL